MPGDIREWKSHQQVVEEVTPATVNQLLLPLTRFFHYLGKDNLSWAQRKNGATLLDHINRSYSWQVC
jgi:hypothetical protein